MLERIRVNVTSNTNHKLIMRASEMAFHVIEICCTKILGINMTGLAANVKADDQFISSVKQISCEMVYKMTPERQLVL